VRVHKCPDCGLELGVGSDRPEFTLGETRTTAFRYRRKVSPVAEPRTLPVLGGGVT